MAKLSSTPTNTALKALSKVTPGSGKKTYQAPSSSPGQHVSNDISQLINSSVGAVDRNAVNDVQSSQADAAPGIAQAGSPAPAQVNPQTPPQGDPQLPWYIQPPAQQSPQNDMQSLMSQIPAGLMPTEVPKYDGSHVGEGMGAVNSLGTILGLLSGHNGYMGHATADMMTALLGGQQQRANDEFKRNEQQFEMRHQLSGEYLNSARYQQMMQLKERGLDQTSIKGAGQIEKQMQDLMAQAYDPKDPKATQAAQEAILKRYSGDPAHPGILMRLSQNMFDPSLYYNPDGSWRPIINQQKQQALDTGSSRAHTYSLNAKERGVVGSAKLLDSPTFWQLPQETKVAVMRQLEEGMELPKGTLGNPPSHAQFNQVLQQKGLALKYKQFAEHVRQDGIVNGQNDTRIKQQGGNYASLIAYRKWQENGGGAGAGKIGGLTPQQIIADRASAGASLRALRSQAIALVKDLRSPDADKKARAEQVTREAADAQDEYNMMDQLFKQYVVPSVKSGSSGNSQVDTGNITGVKVPPANLGPLPVTSMPTVPLGGSALTPQETSAVTSMGGSVSGPSNPMPVSNPPGGRYKLPKFTVGQSVKVHGATIKRIK